MVDRWKFLFEPQLTDVHPGLLQKPRCMQFSVFSLQKNAVFYTENCVLTTENLDSAKALVQRLKSPLQSSITALIRACR